MPNYDRSHHISAPELFQEALGLRGSGIIWGPSANRWTRWLLLLVGVVLFAVGPVWAGGAALPPGVPDIYDPAVRAHYQTLAVVNVQDNPDLPAILLANTDGDQPRGLFLALDARNGKDTWSLTEDPLILIAVYAGAATPEIVYVDTGFVDQGKASGKFIALDPASPTFPELIKRFTEGSRRAAARMRLTAAGQRIVS
jgi:hypothetical protein